MKTMEELKLKLVMFAAMSDIDNHINKKKQHTTANSECYFKISYFTEGKSEIASDHLSKQIIHEGA